MFFFMKAKESFPGVKPFWLVGSKLHSTNPTFALRNGKLSWCDNFCSTKQECVFYGVRVWLLWCGLEAMAAL